MNKKLNWDQERLLTEEETSWENSRGTRCRWPLGFEGRLEEFRGSCLWRESVELSQFLWLRRRVLSPTELLYSTDEVYTPEARRQTRTMRDKFKWNKSIWRALSLTWNIEDQNFNCFLDGFELIEKSTRWLIFWWNWAQREINEVIGKPNLTCCEPELNKAKIK